EAGLVNRTSSPDLGVAWDPRNPTASARRSRVMVLEMALVRATDALDFYISQLRLAPTLLQDSVLRNEIDGCDRSVLRKFKVMLHHSKPFDELIAAMTDVMIVWRNRSVHSMADNEIDPNTLDILRKNEQRVRGEFEGMSTN